MSGKNILTLMIVGWLLLQPITIVSSQEAGQKMLVFQAKPVSVEEFAQEWKGHRRNYPLIYSIMYSLIYLK